MRPLPFRGDAVPRAPCKLLKKLEQNFYVLLAIGKCLTLAHSLSNSAGNLEQPKLTKFDTYDRFLNAAEAFKAENGSLYCRDLLTEEGPQPLPCCMKCVKNAAAWLENVYFAPRS